jgi:hypothetical protein
MSSNPNTVKSQDDLSTTNDGKRSSDVLLSTIEELERTKKQLEIAVKALRGVRVWANTGNGGEQAVKKLCDETLKEIEELGK